MRPSIGLPELLLVFLTASVVAVVVLPACRICAKAGYSRWLGVLSIVPGANVLLLLFMAYSTWPIERGVTSSQRSAQAGG